MTPTEIRKLVVLRIALVAVAEYLRIRASGNLGDADIETLIMLYGQDDNVTAEEVWNSIEESLNDAFHL